MRRLCAFVAVAIAMPSALAEPIVADPSVFFSNWQVINEGASRGSSTPRRFAELTVGVYPSPDSDVTGFFGAPQTSNGGLTTVTGAHDFLTEGAFESLLHAGPFASGDSRGYVWGTYVAYGPPADIAPAVVSPWTVRVENPAGPTTTSTEFVTRALDPDAVPELVRDVTIQGAGLTPTIRWKNNGPNDEVAVFISRVINDATNTVRQVHAQPLAAGTESYELPAAFSGAASVDPADSSLRIGEQYVILIESRNLSDPAIPASAGGGIAGISRSFFEFTAVADNGMGDEAIFIPTVTVDPDTGSKVFNFDIEVTAGEAVFIDPEIAIGYTYEVAAGDPSFASVLLPTLPGADEFYDLILFDEFGNAFDTDIDLVAGEWFDFTTGLADFGVGAEGLSKFRILGIEIDAMVDPSDVRGFVTGLTFTEDGRFRGTQQAVTIFVDVPAPAPFGLVLLALLAAGFRRARVCRV